MTPVEHGKFNVVRLTILNARCTVGAHEFTADIIAEKHHEQREAVSCGLGEPLCDYIYSMPICTIKIRGLNSIDFMSEWQGRRQHRRLDATDRQLHVMFPDCQFDSFDSDADTVSLRAYGGYDQFWSEEPIETGS